MKISLSVFLKKKFKRKHRPSVENKRCKTNSRSGSEKNKAGDDDTRSCGSDSDGDSGLYRTDRAEESLTKTILSEGEETQTLTGVYNNTDFCIGVASNVMLKRAKEGINFAISPLCLHLSLSLVAKGSSGDTLNQLLSLLGLKSAEDLDSQTCHMLAHLSDQKGGRGPLLSFVNGAWIRKGLTFKPAFKAAVSGVYKAQTQEVDFETKADEIIKEINSWADNATKGLIKHLLPSGSIDGGTNLVLANALYFKGRWQQIFHKSQTITKDFHLLNSRVVRVPFMTCSGTYLYGSFDGYQVVTSSYQSTGKRFSMHFLLPDTIDGLPNLVQKVISNPSVLNQQLKFDHVDLWIPRFKFSSEFEASQNMKQLGLVLPFQIGGLTEMVDDSSCIRLSKIFHKSCIEVNEQGTKAVAANFRMFAESAELSFPRIFVANRPFMFMIREETSRIVFFTGAVLNPLEH